MIKTFNRKNVFLKKYLEVQNRVRNVHQEEFT